MLFGEAFKLALQSLWANKMRTILTLIGVIIGVSSVIMVVTLTNGAKQFVTSKINTYGAAVITVSKMPQTFMTIEEYVEFQKRKDITYDDYRAILTSAGPAYRWERSATQPARLCAEPSPPPTLTFAAGRGRCRRSRISNIVLGRSFTEMEDQHSAHVAIVGSDIVDNVLGAGDPLGKEIRVDGAPYTVIGVGESQGKMFGQQHGQLGGDSPHQFS